MKEKIKTIYLILGIILFILIAIAITIWILKQVEINWEALTFNKLECKKEYIKQLNFDPNMYLKDLYSGGWGIYANFKGYNQIVEIISALTKKNEKDIKNLIENEYFRLSNKSGWQQMNPLKIKDLTGEIINWDSLDYKNPELLSKFCKRPRFIKLSK